LLVVSAAHLLTPSLSDCFHPSANDGVNKWAAETARNVASGVNDIQDVIYKDISGYKDEEGNFHTVEILNSK
jgi:hypothetical protein